MLVCRTSECGPTFCYINMTIIIKNVVIIVISYCKTNKKYLRINSITVKLQYLSYHVLIS